MVVGNGTPHPVMGTVGGSTPSPAWCLVSQETKLHCGPASGARVCKKPVSRWKTGGFPGSMGAAFILRFHLSDSN